MNRKIFALLALVGLTATSSWAASKSSSIAGGEGNYADKVFTVSKPTYIVLSKNDSNNRNTTGWYAGLTITWENKANASSSSKAKVEGVHPVDEYTVYSLVGGGDQSKAGSGLKFTFQTNWGTSYLKTCTWWVYITAEDAYKLNGADYEATLTVAGETFKIVIPATTYNAGLVDSSGVQWFPAVALIGSKVYGDIDVALDAAGDVGMVADAAVKSEHTLVDGMILRKNGKTLSFEGGSITATLGAKFDFDPAGLYDAETYKANGPDSDGLYTIAYNHVCDWQYTGDGTAELTATCQTASECPYGKTLKVSLNIDDEVPYTGSAVSATKTVPETFTEATGLTVGEITYWQEETKLAVAPKYKGEYEARLTVGSYTLKKAFAITHTGDWSDGYSVERTDVRYDTLAEAIAAAEDGDTVKYWTDDNRFTGFTVDVGDKNVTLNLNGKTLTGYRSDITITGKGSGTVAIIGGTIKQAARYSSKDYGLKVTGGTVVFGADLKLENVGDREARWFKVAASGSGTKLSITNGQYQAIFATSDSGAVEISGGKFWSNFNPPSSMLADGYAVRTIGGEYPYEVIKHEHVMVTDIIGENTLSNYCAAGGCDLAVGQWATIAVTTPATYTGKAFAGVTKTGDLAVTLTYFKGEDSLGGAPTAAGDDYKVVMSYNDKAITNGFEITAATIDSISFDPAEADFTGSPITTKMTVKAGSLTLGDGDYDITAGSVTETGSASATTNIEVTVVGKGNFQGTKTGSWTIKAPGTGDATFKTPTIGGDYGTLNGTTLTIDEKSVNLKETSAGSGVWTMSMTVGVPLSQSGTKYVFTPEALLFFTKEDSDPVDGTQTEALEEFGIVVKKGAEISAGTYDGQYKAESFTWTETITVAEAVEAAAAGEEKIVRTIKAYAVSYSETASYIYTLTNEGGLPETTYTMEIPLASLKLIDEYGNQRYPVLDYVAKIGNVEYTSVSNALEAAEENETVELTADDPVAGAYDLPVGVTLKLGDFGNSDATYKLYASSKLISAEVIDAGRLSADTGLGVKEPQSVEGGYLYETEIVHTHEWTFAAVGNVLTATCANSKGDCYLKDEYDCKLTITLNAEGGEWTGKAFAATVDDGFVVGETPEVKDYSIDEVTYSACDRDGQWGAYTTAKPVQVGKYKAQVTVTVDGAEGSPFTLDTPEYEITRPTGGYSSGYELKETGGHYTSFDAAVADARDGDTIVWYEGGDNQRQATFDFKSNKNITVDLNGKNFSYDSDGHVTIKNLGSGRVTLINGTLRTAGSGLSINHNIYLQGKLTLGEGISVEKYSFASSAGLDIREGADIILAGGTYRGTLDVDANSKLTITGGKYNLNYLSAMTTYVPDRGDKYVVRSISEDSGNLIYYVVPHTHVWTGSANGGVLTVKCTGTDSTLCNYKDGATITLTAVNATATGEAYAGAAVDNQFAADEELAKRCPEAAALSVADVVYYTKDDQTTPITPVECGEYFATISYSGATASAAFTIWHAEHSYAFTADDDADTITAKCEAEGPCEEDNKEYVAALTVEGKLVDGEPCEATTDVDDGFPAEVTLEYWQDQTKLDDAPAEVGSYIAKMIATTNNATAALVEKAFEIRAGKVTVNGKGYDNVTDAFGDLLKDKGWATFNDTGITYDGMTFQRGATLTVADDNSWIITNEGGTSLIATKVPGKMNLTVDGTFELSGDIYVAPAGEEDTVVTVTNFMLDASITVGKESDGATDAMAYLSFYTFTNENQANYRITLTTNGVVRSAERLTIENVFAEVEHFEVVEDEIEGGYEYTLEASEFKVNYYDNDGETVVHTDTATILNYTGLQIWNGDREGLVLLGYKKENGEALEQSDAALHAYIKEEAENPGCDGVVKVFGTWEKATITITIVEGNEITDVQMDGESVDEELELPADAKAVTLTLEAGGLTVPVFKVVRGNVTNVTTKVATYDIKDGDTLEFFAEEADETDPTVDDDQIKTAIIDAIDPADPDDEDDVERYNKAKAKVEAVVGDNADQVPAKDFAAYINKNGVHSFEIADCDYVAASVKLDTGSLIDEDTEVEIAELVKAEGNALTFAVEIDGDQVAVEAIKDMVEATSDLSDWAKNKLEVDATFDEGKITITPQGSPDKAFMRVVIPKDPGAAE